MTVLIDELVGIGRKEVSKEQLLAVTKTPGFYPYSSFHLCLLGTAAAAFSRIKCTPTNIINSL